MKKYLWIIICLVALLAAGSALGVEAMLPPGYGEGTDSHAVIYLMPEEPGKAVNSGLTELLRAEMEQNDVLPMILVPVEVAAGQDPMAALRETVAATDAEYRTVPDAAHRAAVGIGAGGYLAYLALLEEDPVISAAASIRGRFAGGRSSLAFLRRGSENEDAGDPKQGFGLFRPGLYLSGCAGRG